MNKQDSINPNNPDPKKINLKKIKPINQRKLKTNKPKPLKKQILIFIMTCWLIPIFIFGLFFVHTYQNTHMEKAEEMIVSSIRNSAELVSTRINEAIMDIESPSYEREWENQYWELVGQRLQTSDLYMYLNASIKEKYYYNARYMSYAFYLDGMDEIFCYGSRRGSDVNDFSEKIEPYLWDSIKEDSNYTKVLAIDNRIFILRNLYTVANYERFGTLIIELNIEKLLENTSLNIPADVVLLFNDKDFHVHVKENEESMNVRDTMTKLVEFYNARANNHMDEMKEDSLRGYLYQIKEDKYHMGIAYLTDYQYLYQNYEQLFFVIGVLLVVFVPLLIFALLFMKRQIEDPVQKLIEVSREIQDGKIGTTCSGYKMPNKEFADLIYSFNNMSLQVKYLFDTVYNEKLERKDAQIAALQSQINPHFLNNTLEMMNWQARMNNDITLSKMIEALGTFLDYSINRENNAFFYLSEELRCADAYMYLMSMRFGKRLKFEKEIDESLLRTEVPQLILQPILENAIVHGIEKIKSGSIILKIYQKEEDVYLDVINSSKELTSEAEEKIARLLDGSEEIKKQKGQHVSIGIRNVNRRIKLLYGENYGLTIKKLDESNTISTISIPMHELEKIKKPTETDSKEEELEHILNVLNRF